MEFTRPITPFMPLAEKRDLLPEGGSSPLFAWLAQNAEFFASGRDAMARALRLASRRALALQNNNKEIDTIQACAAECRVGSANFAIPEGWRGRIFLPSYFCPWVIKLAQFNWGSRVVFYDDFPSEPAPRFASLSARPGDVVVAVNFFGSRDFSEWREWRKENSQVVFIKDVSHAPFAEISRKILGFKGRGGPETRLNSGISDFKTRGTQSGSGFEADYTFASLRKTLPLCDGGFLYGKDFKPAKIYQNSGELSDFSAAYLDAAAIERLSYNLARDFYYNAEMRLNAKCGISRICAYSYNALKTLDLELLWRRRAENFEALRRAVSGSDLPCRLLSPRDSALGAFSYFCPTFCFENVKIRDKYYAKLAEYGILPSIYWGAKFLRSASAKEESSKFMTVSLDFRHSVPDALKFAEIFTKIK